MKKLIYRLFIFLLIFAPLAFGAVESWALAVMEGAALLILALLWVQRKDEETQWVEVPGFLPLMLFLGYILLQLVPLPAVLIKLVSPSTHRIYADTVGIFDPKAWLPLTVNQKATLSEFFLFAAYTALYISTVQLLTDQTLLKRTVYILVGFGAVFALVAIVQHITAPETMFWFRSVPRTSGFGTYVNRNHYAGLMEMLIPIAVSLFLLMRPVVCYTSLRERIVEFFSQPRSHTYVLIGYGCILMAASVFVSLSRGGISGLCLGLSLLGVLLLIRGKNKKAGISLCVLFIVVLFSVGWFGWDPIFDRFQKIRNIDGDIADSRLLIWQDSIRIMTDFPISGAGFGSFGAIFPAYRSFPGGMTFSHAHNDYIELATDGGLIAVVLASWFLGIVFLQSFRTIKKRREPFSVYIFVGCAAGLFSILIHSLTDFNLHLGANGLYFFLMLGILVSAANTRLRSTQKATLLKAVNNDPWKHIAIPVFLILLSAVTFNLGTHTGERFSAPLWKILFNKEVTSEQLALIHANLDKAAIFDRLHAMYPLLKANTIMLHDDNPETALPFYHKAIRLAPSNALFLRELALFHAARGSDGETADKLFRAAIHYGPTDSDGYKEYGVWLINRQRKEEGFLMIKKAISIAPSQTKSCMALMLENKLALTDIPRVLPDRVAPHLIYAAFLATEGMEDLAARAFATALDQINNEPVITAGWFHQVCGYYRKRKQYDKALGVMLAAIHHLPKDVRVRLETASLYETLQITFRAKEEYTHALFLEPDNKEAKRRMESLLNLNS
ncbi:MAG: O-antigen ligase family protein [Desulfobacterales bacterium]|jgi:O-antigen ligase/Tfp pilus assembly protein PilF|nr:O-antigen ligase family protein [Desulfobacterales bacterium]